MYVYNSFCKLNFIDNYFYSHTDAINFFLSLRISRPGLIKDPNHINASLFNRLFKSLHGFNYAKSWSDFKSRQIVMTTKELDDNIWDDWAVYLTFKISLNPNQQIKRLWIIINSVITIPSIIIMYHLIGNQSLIMIMRRPRDDWCNYFSMITALETMFD